MIRYVLPYREFRRLHRRASAAQQRDHAEVCGVLAGRAGKSRRLVMRFLPNQAKRAGAFLLKHVDITATRREIKAAGLHPIGMFHSHPVGYARLGPRDKKATPLNWLHLVYDVCALEPKQWRAVRHGRQRVVVEIPLAVQRSSNGKAR